MTDREIIEGNALIAAFLNKELYDKWIDLNNKNLKFHSSWDWLMSAIERMKLMGYCYTSDPWSHEIIEYISGDEKQIGYFEKDSEYTEIENLFYTVVDFIKWYNRQSNKK